MKRNNRFLYFVLVLLFISKIISAQPVEKIRFKKDPSLIYFFQKNSKSDTLRKGEDNLFYLIVSDSLKKNLSIALENGQLMPTENDSLVRLNYLPGFKYESFYVTEEKPTGKKYKFQTLVDGISSLPPERIVISLINKSTGGLILENSFIYVR